MKSALQGRMLQTMGRHSMVRPGDRVGIGVSGGADSVALLGLLAELRTDLGITVFVLHFHHQLRGIEADEDERFVKNLADEFGFECLSGRGDVATEALRNGWNLEDAARRMRYEFFASVISSRNLNRVAVAHTSDDQAETVLAHLLRGTGLAGLAGIYPVSGSIIRPLLEIEREELREYLLARGRTWREDASNRDTSRTRARIRHQLLPILRRDFEPATVTRFARLASLAREDEMFWRALENERFSALALRESSSVISIGIADLLSPMASLAAGDGNSTNCANNAGAPMIAVSRRLIRKLISELRGTRQQITARHIQDVLDLATKSQSGARIELPGITVERTFDRLQFSIAPQGRAREAAEPSYACDRDFEYAISAPDPPNGLSVAVPEIQRRFDLKLIDWPAASGETGRYRRVLDFDALRWPLVLRNWRPGDSYRPQGHRRVRKLKRFFLESRVPRRNRTSWPVLISAGQLVWAAGYPVAEAFAPGRGTRIGLIVVEQEWEGRALTL